MSYHKKLQEIGEDLSKARKSESSISSTPSGTAGRIEEQESPQ
jgi:hypothetical protein